ncbi:hypothetical protein D0T51_12250 [Parabacteroides sp. 52]|uniref:Fic family protein n=1 Tax=unclassified Parabacteroides TaxID=2649774 RepID=UPI0013D6ADB7|nr:MULTISPECIES: Fic family protein [unclassified Parabacteroides]MDH6534062.1 Fic family protein [Parabacteroides sp. PM5-20]NDV56489.1 hypothetical protein [Parabacteroides sp. 52]
MDLQLLTSSLFAAYSKAVDMNWTNIKLSEESSLPNVKPFDFYNSVASVYSSKIEGENIELDSYVKHKFYKVPYQADYTKKADDLFEAYQYAQSHPLTFENVMEAHKILSKNLLSPSARGVLRNSIMFVMDDKDQIAYVACEPQLVESETEKLFNDIELLLKTNLSIEETFYYASLIHLMFVKIHPMQDGNGRLARLIEKWFIASKLGKEYWRMKSEKYYYSNLKDYYRNLAITGLEYDEIDMTKSIPFLSMLPKSIAFE